MTRRCRREKECRCAFLCLCRGGSCVCGGVAHILCGFNFLLSCGCNDFAALASAVFYNLRAFLALGKEAALVAALTALAVASRAVFYFVPQFKPIGAVVIVSAVCPKPRRGYIIGALSAFISNFIFGQGVWTPFQMVALGLVGFFAGLLFRGNAKNRWLLAAAGFILTFALYGLVADLSSVLTLLSEYTLSGILAIYAAGVPFSAIFGGATALFLLLFGQAFIKKINRVVEKYGILAGDKDEE